MTYRRQRNKVVSNQDHLLPEWERGLKRVDRDGVVYLTKKDLRIHNERYLSPLNQKMRYPSPSRPGKMTQRSKPSVYSNTYGDN